MDRIKNIEEVIIGGGEVLVELIQRKRKSGIVLPESSMKDEDNSDFGIIVAVGNEVKDLEVGDIVLKTRTQEAPGYQFGEKSLLMFNRYNIAVAVKPVNFSDNDELSA